VDAHRLVDGLPDHEVGQHRGRRLRDRAAERVVRHVLDLLAAGTVRQVHPKGHLVTARRVDVMDLRLEGLAQPSVVGVLVVVEDDLLVQGIQFRGHDAQLNLKYWRVYSRPSTSASISAGVV
jgi:hypothetical protein